MSKVLLINGIPKAKGNTFIALSEVQKTLEEEGIETGLIHVGQFFDYPSTILRPAYV